jgi:hypothetical protein
MINIQTYQLEFVYLATNFILLSRKNKKYLLNLFIVFIKPYESVTNKPALRVEVVVNDYIFPEVEVYFDLFITILILLKKL